ncbi:MAG: SUMF1/EgtB/PvdO family nonheme iron enzyme [Candidatus Aminicenantes bacterium]|nr:SUMF1/EgtB/PvdO family nonheme iron enzyme [Candidatus Aminicenantes bacterium]
MTKSNIGIFKTKTLVYLLPLLVMAVNAVGFKDNRDGMMTNMVLVKGGTFMMGDVFGDGEKNEKPVHQVTLSDFYLDKNEVTVGQFRIFVKETGYKTSAESPKNWAEQQQLMTRARTEKLTPEESRKMYDLFLSYGGTFYWDTESHRFGYSTEYNWDEPGFEQTDRNPVVNMSWNDAVNYCNWLSRKKGLPVAYDLKTGGLLDENGNITLDISKVRGYRLPTEAEWEYAAREGGKRVRFGNGKNIAQSSEINFRADYGDYSYLKKGEYLKKTVPVGSYESNCLGLYDMSGNAWEWCSDFYGDYSIEEQIDPYPANGVKRVIRGGRWGGNASEVRVFSRDAYVRNNRCNNAGFRIAKSK